MRSPGDTCTSIIVFVNQNSATGAHSVHRLDDFCSLHTPIRYRQLSPQPSSRYGASAFLRPLKYGNQKYPIQINQSVPINVYQSTYTHQYISINLYQSIYANRHIPTNQYQSICTNQSNNLIQTHHLANQIMHQTSSIETQQSLPNIEAQQK